MADVHGWRYYHNAYLPETQPDEEADLSQVTSGSLWKQPGQRGILARWTSDFDCGYETQWWYVIKDTPFDLQALKAKRRYEINKGLKNFRIERIAPQQYREELFAIQVDAYSVYPEKYRPRLDKTQWQESVCGEWDTEDTYVFAAFDKETGTMCGYAQLSKKNRCINFARLKTMPRFEKLGVNAALVAWMLDFFREDLENGRYICDGARNIQHETAFQDYLEKYFGFRKAYCKLNVAYAPGYGAVVRMAYLFRPVLKRLDHVGIVHKINGVLQMEEIVRSQDRTSARK